MSATPVFGLVAADLQAKLQPINGSYTFSIGSGGDLSSGDAEGILAIAEDQALMRIPTRYRQLMRDCDGESLIANARGGETSLRCQLYPVTSGTLQVFRNYPRHATWKNRNVADALVAGTDYTVVEATGVITLTTPLSLGDYVWAAYQHTAGTRMLGLRDIVLSIAAAETARRFSYFRTAEGFDRFERWETSAYANLNQMRGLDVIDRVQLLAETDDTYANILRM